MAASDIRRLVLGTVQLGMDYGVANASGKPDPDVALMIVRTAWDGGVREFDTAQGYGDSEAVLGNVFAALGIGDQAQVMTKPDKQLDCTTPGRLEAALEASRAMLGVPRLRSVMLHSEALLDQWDEVFGPLFAQLREKGCLEQAGVSVYTPEAAIRALRTEGLDVVQLPSSPLDRRFEREGVYDQARLMGKSIYVRSIYLQGLLLMDPDRLPPYVAHARTEVARFQALAQELGVTPAGLAMFYVRDAFPETNILFGAETAAQVAENLDLWRAEAPDDLVRAVQEAFGSVSEDIVNPMRWNR